MIWGSADDGHLLYCCHDAWLAVTHRPTQLIWDQIIPCLNNRLAFSLWRGKLNIIFSTVTAVTCHMTGRFLTCIRLCVRVLGLPDHPMAGQSRDAWAITFEAGSIKQFFWKNQLFNFIFMALWSGTGTVGKTFTALNYVHPRSVHVSWNCRWKTQSPHWWQFGQDRTVALIVGHWLCTVHQTCSPITCTMTSSSAPQQQNK